MVKQYKKLEQFLDKTRRLFDSFMMAEGDRQIFSRQKQLHEHCPGAEKLAKFEPCRLGGRCRDDDHGPGGPCAPCVMRWTYGA